MRWLRLLLLGLASVYPLYWTAQFVLFFVPESLVSFWTGDSIRVVGISYLQVTSVAGYRAVYSVQVEALIAALTCTLLIVGLRGDRYLTGALAIVILGQSALLPFLSLARESRGLTAEAAMGILAVFAMVVLGLFRVLQHTGGMDFLDRLAILTLLAVLPQVALWLAFRAMYPFFGTRFLLMLLIPLYLGAIAAAALPVRIATKELTVDFLAVPWSEIVASSAAAGLLLIAITLTSHSMSVQNSRIEQRQDPPDVQCSDRSRHDSASCLARPAEGMLT
jgi:hypothetical protein